MNRAEARLGNMKMTNGRTRARVARPCARWPVATAILLAIALFPPGAARAALYKWVDDKGVVHYTDKVPVDAVNKGRVQLSPQGIAIKKVDPASAPDKRKAGAAEPDRQPDASKDQDGAARRDRALLDSYTSESEIDLAKARAVRTLEAALQSAQGYSAQLTKRRAALGEKRAAYAGKAVPADIEREMAAIDVELARQNDIVAQKNRQLVEVASRYDADKERWHALKSSSGATKPPSAPGMAAAPAAAPSPQAPSRK
jgi:hypothetical protein